MNATRWKSSFGALLVPRGRGSSSRNRVENALEVPARANGMSDTE